MKGVGGEEHAAHTKFGDQGLDATDLVRRGRHFVVRQDHRRVAGKRAQHVCRGAVVQMVEAAAQRLAIERDCRPRRWLHPGGEHGGERPPPGRRDRASRTGGARVFTAGARRSRAPKRALRRSRWTAMKVTMLWYEVAPDSTAKTENSSRWLIE